MNKNKAFNPLWIEGRTKWAVSPYTSISLPDWHTDHALHVKSLGFDSCIFGSFSQSEEASSTKDLDLSCFTDIRKQGINIGIKATFDVDLITKKYVLSPLDDQFKSFLANEIETLFKSLPRFDFLGFESLALLFDEMGLNQDDEHLIAEIAKAEISLIERIINNRAGLIYIVPKHDALFLKEIALDAGLQTWITLSSRAGNPFQDHLNVHHFLLNSKPEELSGLQLAAVLNIGGIHQGGGLWPTVPLDIIQSIYPYLIDLDIRPLPCIHGLPKKGSLLEASLLIASKALQGQIFPEKELQKWLQENDYEAMHLIQDLKEVRSIVVNLSLIRALFTEKSRDHMSQDETKYLAASTLYRLRSLSKQSHNFPFNDALIFFLRDAERIVLHFVQSFNVVLHEPFEQDLGKKGFWTAFEPGAGAGAGIRSFGKVTFSKIPLLDLECKQMMNVYAESGWS